MTNTASAPRRSTARVDLERSLGGCGPLSKAVRANGLRRSRHVGAAKTHLQQVLTAAAINLGRIADRIAGQTPAQTRKSALVRLVTTPI